MVDVSVILPVYNAGRFLEEAVDSILTQQGVDFELIAIDDCSTDGSRAALERYAATDRRVKLILNEQNVGHAVAINAGIAAAGAPVSAIMHADDVALPGRLAAQHRLLADQPDVDVVGTWFACIDIDGHPHETGVVKHPTNPANVAWQMHFDCYIGHPTAAGRTRILRATPYDSGFHGAEDYHLWSRLLFRHRMSNVPKVLLNYRIHPNQVSQRLIGRMTREAAEVRQRAIAALVGQPVSLELGDLVAMAEFKSAPIGFDDFLAGGELLTRMLEAFLERMPKTNNVVRVVHNYHAKLAALGVAADASASTKLPAWTEFTRRGLAAAERFNA